MMTHPRRTFRLVAAVIMVLLVTPVASAVATDETVSIGAKLSPKNLTVAPGTNITWVNDDDERHRMRSESGPEEFDSGNLEPGESFTFNFAIEGSYSYIDDRDDENTAYHGAITVASDAPPPDPSEPPPPPPAAGDVNIVDRSFQPASLTISPGGTVTWANNDDDEHTVTANDGSWDSGIFAGGATFERTFADPGAYAYFCIIHPDMTGTITVVAEEGEPPPPPPPPDPDPAPPPPAPPPAAGDVNVFDFGFTPGNLTVGVGSSVTWTNTGAAPHTVTDNAGRFDSGFLFAGETYTRTFDAAGTYDYICTLHPEMTATVVVNGDGSSPPPPGDPDPAPNDPVPPPPAQPTSGDITIVDNAFSPGTRSVTTGTTVVWVNAGAVPHTVTSSSGMFDSGFLFTGDIYRRTFSSPGTFDYICTIHPGMAGSIVVTGAPTGDPPGEGEATIPLDPSASDHGGGEAAAPSNVSIVDNAFAPKSVTVAAGSSVAWVNNGALPHTVTSQGGVFDSGILLPAADFSVRLSIPGTYDYVCTLHPEMAGTIVVTEASGLVDAGDGSSESAAAEVGDPTGHGGEATGDAAAGTEPVIARTVQMIDNAFQPRAVTVESGEAVRWRNEGAVPHTATVDGVFDSGFVEPGGDFVQVFDELGTHDYWCTIHPEMTGTIEVVAPVAETAAGGGTPGTPAAPLDPAVAFVMAGGIVVAVGLMAFGMARFAAAASEMR